MLILKMYFSKNFGLDIDFEHPLGSGWYATVYPILNYPYRVAKIISQVDYDDILFVNEKDINLFLRSTHLSPYLYTAFSVNNIIDKTELKNYQEELPRVFWYPKSYIMIFDRLDGHVVDLKINYETYRQIEHILKSKLTSLHSLGILHLDIKSTNVMYKKTSTGLNLFFTDFGLSACNTHLLQQSLSPFISACFRFSSDLDLTFDNGVVYDFENLQSYVLDPLLHKNNLQNLQNLQPYKTYRT